MFLGGASEFFTGGATLAVSIPMTVASVSVAIVSGAGAVGALGNMIHFEVLWNSGGKGDSKPQYKKPVLGKSAKEAAKDVPSWAKGNKQYTNENGNDFATRLLDEKYGKGNYPKGAGTEYSKIRKWGDRGFE